MDAAALRVMHVGSRRVISNVQRCRVHVVTRNLWLTRLDRPVYSAMLLARMFHSAAWPRSQASLAFGITLFTIAHMRDGQ